MSLRKYAEVSASERTVDVIDAFVVPSNVGHKRLARMRRRAHRHQFEYSPRPGYIYVRSRAISSRCNDNFDEFPAAEIKAAYRTFIGKPVFVNHHNADHRRARGVIIDAALHEDTNPDGSEDTWAEVLMEVDAVRFPVLARECLKGNIARTSMGTDVAYSECTACGNRAATPADYCQHIPRMKGSKYRRPIMDAHGKVAGTEEILIAERCYGLGFFENSLLVEDPADPTAFSWVDGVGEGVDTGISSMAAKAVLDEAEAITREAAAQRHPGDLTTLDGLKVGDRLLYGHWYVGHRVPVVVSAVNPDGTVTVKGKDLTEVVDESELASEEILLSRDTDEVDLAVAASTSRTASRRESAVEALLRAEAGNCTVCNPSYASAGLPAHLCNSHAFVAAHGDPAFTDLTAAMHPGETMDFGRISSRRANHQHTAYGETKAPAKVDTMRAENCPVCGDDEGYNGDKCSVCGYMQPPSQFSDPDLTKARENDLRQEQVDAGALPTEPGAETAPEGSDLKCDQCGEVFSAEGDAATGAAGPQDSTDPTEIGPEDTQEDPAADPSDLSDLADLSDDEIFDDTDGDGASEADGDEDEKPVEKAVEEKVDEEIDDKVEDEARSDKPDFLKGDDDEDPADPEQDPVSSATDPAVGEARITAEPEAGTETTLDTPVAAGQTCPVCGKGTLSPLATTVATDGKEPKMNEVGTSPIKQPVASRHAAMSKETVDMNQPAQNAAQKQRSLLVAAVREQQQQIDGLTTSLAYLAVAAGLERHPKFAGIVREAGIRVQADDDTNSGDSIGGTPSTTTEQAAKPDATDDVESMGAVPAPANVGVTPAAVTDVNNSDVAVNPPVLDNLQSVTQPVAGTDAVTPAAGDAAGASTVTVGTPSNEAFDKPGDSGWKTSAAARGTDMDRYVAAQRLARLQIEAGIAQGEDIAIAQSIAASDTPLGEITAAVSALAAVASRAAAPAPRHLVPRAAARGAAPAPSMTGGAAPVITATAGRSGEDEWMLGADTDFNV